MLLGYARVSTDGKDLALQRAALREAAGAGSAARQHARGDIVVVTRLDRLARSTRDLLDIVERQRDAAAGLHSLAEPWTDTISPAGRTVLTVFAGIAEFERSLILARTGAEGEAVKWRGVRFGRPAPRSPRPRCCVATTPRSTGHSTLERP